MIKRNFINIAFILLYLMAMNLYANTYYEVQSPEVFESEFKFQGRLVPGEMLQLYSPYEGEVKQLLVRNGQDVKKDELLLEIYAAKLKQAIELANVAFLSKEAHFKHLSHFQSSIEYKQLYTGFQRAKRHAEYSQQRFQDSQSLLELGIISKDEFNQDRRSYEETQQNWRDAEQLLLESEKKSQPPFLTIAELEYNLAKQHLHYLQTIQSQLSLKAPFSGRVIYTDTEGEKRLAVGTQISQKQALLSIANLKNMQLLIEVDESMVIKLKQGLKAKLKFQAFSSELLNGTIASIEAKNLMTQDQKMPRYHVRIDFHPSPKIQKHLYFGMTAAILITLKTDSALYHLPKQAVTYHDQQYWVKKSDMNTLSITEVPIQFEVVDDHLVAVRQGVKAGDCLVIPD